MKKKNIENDIIENDDEFEESDFENEEDLLPVPEPDAVRTIFEWVEMFVYAFSAVLIVMTFIARPSPVDGESMLNTLHHNELLIVSDLFYTPERGDVVVFQSKPTGYDKPYVKRIIALEGQTIDINFDTWEVTVDDVVLDEYYVRTESKEMRGSNYEFPMVIPKGHVFVMGDNRNNSQDSRSSIVGPVDMRYILGRVVFRIFPLDRIGHVD
jgi:signal peptidase I, bacterial type